jgi:hypothetical protein
MWLQHKLIWIGVAVAATFWLLEAAIHTWLFGEGAGLCYNIAPHSANEWWMRSLAALLFIGFGAYADHASHTLVRAQEERRVIQARLDDALTRVLRGYLSICASCKAIREGERWTPLETYVTDHTKALFSHGLCPTCLSHFEQSA